MGSIITPTEGAMELLDPAHGEALFDALHRDADAGVRKVALRSAAALNSPAMLQRLRTLSTSDPEPGLRELASTLLRTAGHSK
jgi:hypothetical protein